VDDSAVTEVMAIEAVNRESSQEHPLEIQATTISWRAGSETITMLVDEEPEELSKSKMTNLQAQADLRFAPCHPNRRNMTVITDKSLDVAITKLYFDVQESTTQDRSPVEQHPLLAQTLMEEKLSQELLQNFWI